MKKLKTAVIGLGRIGWCYHVPQVVKNPGFELTAIVDPLEERRHEGETTYGTKAYPDLDALFRHEKLDVVVIASPTRFHCRQALQAMENGCDVFCDKPMAMNLDEADAMIAGAKKTGQKLMVYQPHRATTEALSLYQCLHRPEIGPVYMIKRSMSNYRIRNDWQAFKEQGGGMLTNFGAHAIDQLLFLTDFSPIRKVSCALRTIVSLGDADDIVKGVFENEAGMILDFDINMAAAFPLKKWQIFGRYGTIIDDGATWKMRYIDPADLPDLSVQEGLAAEKRKYLSHDKIQWQERTIPFDSHPPIDFYEQVYAYFALNAPPYVPITQTREVMRLLHECQALAES